MTVPWGKVVRKNPPLDAAAEEIKDDVEDLAPLTHCGRTVWLENQGPDKLRPGSGSDRWGILRPSSCPFLRPKQGVRFTCHKLLVLVS